MLQKLKRLFGRNLNSAKPLPEDRKHTPGSPEEIKTIPPAPDTEDLPPKVFAAEMAAIRLRRQAFGLEMPPHEDVITPGNNLAGIALSGGGIRSATLNLGLIQALHRTGLFQCMDYMSTVSGGGYIGSCLSSIFATAPDETQVDYYLEGIPDHAALNHGEKTPDGRWRVAGEDAKGLSIRFPASGTGYICRLQARAVLEPASGEQQSSQSVSARLTGDKKNSVPFTCASRHRKSCLDINIPASNDGTPCTFRFSIQPETFPFRHHNGEPESEAFKHMRDNSNYLKPKQFLAGLRIPGLFIRGLLVNFVIVLPILLLAALATIWLSGSSISRAIYTESFSVDIPSPLSLGYEPGPLKSLYQHHIHVADHIAPNSPLLNLSEPRTPQEATCYFIALSNVPDPIKVIPNAHLHDRQWLSSGTSIDQVSLQYPAGFLEPFSISVVVWAQVMSRTECNGASLAADDKAIKHPIQKLLDHGLGIIRNAVIAAIAIFALYPVLQWLNRSIGTNSWKSRDRMTRWICGGTLLALGLLVFIELQPILIYHFHKAGDSRDTGLGDLSELSTVLSGILTVIASAFAQGMRRKKSGSAGKIGLFLFSFAGPVVLWLVYLNLARWIVLEETAPHWLAMFGEFLINTLKTVSQNADFIFAPSLNLAVDMITRLEDNLGLLLSFLHDHWEWNIHATRMAMAYWAITICTFSIGLLFYDINATSFHRFYRDRLSKTYLFDSLKTMKAGHVIHNDEQKLTRLSQISGPYHLINATINIQRSSTANMRGRNGAHFTFGRDYCGGNLTGYALTRHLEDIHENLDLATAMAISGAAAAPNMGHNTLRGLVLIMTLLNIRLGYWFPNPARIGRKESRSWILRQIFRIFQMPLARVMPFHLLSEMLGNMRETGRFINLTDGGHLENMGLYELVRRRCKLIIVSDAEADPDMHFEGFADAVRQIRIDLGIRIQINIKDIRPGNPASPGTSGRYSRSSFAIGRIHYGKGEIGYLIYFKSAITGTEDIHIQEYAAHEPSFPQQTTADQFFDEAQFEAYRALGFHMASSFLNDPEIAACDISRPENLGTALEKIIERSE